MKIKEAWTIELKNGVYGGLKPIIDPFDKNRFYLSDGWGSAFPSIKLRQLFFSDGKELNSVSIKNIVRCWKIQCKLPPKTKRFCPLVLK